MNYQLKSWPHTHRFYQMTGIEQRKEITGRTYSLDEVREIIQYWHDVLPDYGCHGSTGYASAAIAARQGHADVLLLLDRLCSREYKWQILPR